MASSTTRRGFVLAFGLLLAMTGSGAAQAQLPDSAPPDAMQPATDDAAADFTAGDPGAGERILVYDSEIAIAADGSLDVTERILVHAEGINIRRGIYRDFPTEYEDRRGLSVVVGFEVLSLERDGKPEPWFTEGLANGVRVNFGSDDFLPTPLDTTYTLRFRTTRQLGFFADHDELYWNAIGTGWEFPIEAGTVEATLPQAVPVAQLAAEGYTGAFGDKGTAYRAEIVAPGRARWTLTEPLPPQQGLTVVLSFPKGIVTPPSLMQRLRWFAADNAGVLALFGGLLLLIAYCAWAWRRVGRDPATRTVIVRYEPPAGHSPAGLRFMERMGYDTRCFSADLLGLAVAGRLVVTHEKGGFLSRESWSLRRAGGGVGETSASQATSPVPAEAATLGTALFQYGSDRLELKQANHAILSSAETLHRQALETRFMPALFARNGRQLALAVGIAVVSAAGAFVLSGGGTFSVLKLGLVLGLLVAMVVVLVVFARLVKAPTPAGQRLLEEIEGFRRYLSVAERDELRNLAGPATAAASAAGAPAAAPPPVLNAQRYEQLLPYAVALQVEDAWTARFTAAAGAAAVAAATTQMSWYRGERFSDLGSFSRSIGSSLASTAASASTAPGSSSGGSSGGGGGGSSGGGGGGGGGGGR